MRISFAERICRGPLPALKVVEPELKSRCQRYQIRRRKYEPKLYYLDKKQPFLGIDSLPRRDNCVGILETNETLDPFRYLIRQNRMLKSRTYPRACSLRRIATGTMKFPK